MMSFFKSTVQYLLYLGHLVVKVTSYSWIQCVYTNIYLYTFCWVALVALCLLYMLAERSLAQEHGILCLVRLWVGNCHRKTMTVLKEFYIVINNSDNIQVLDTGSI